jgi:hypothetical protein
MTKGVFAARVADRRTRALKSELTSPKGPTSTRIGSPVAKVNTERSNGPFRPGSYLSWRERCAIGSTNNRTNTTGQGGPSSIKSRRVSRVAIRALPTHHDRAQDAADFDVSTSKDKVTSEAHTSNLGVPADGEDEEPSSEEDFDYPSVRPPPIKNAANWNEQYQKLERYKEGHDNCLVPRDWHKDPKLSRWVRRQRIQYRLFQEGKKTSMTDEQIAKLQNLGFEWAPRGPAVEWDERCQELEKYKERYGNCDVPQSSKEYQKLGRWVMTQRNLYRNESPCMTTERIVKLASVGFAWSVRGYRG